MQNKKLAKKHIRSRETFIRHSGLSVNEEPTQVSYTQKLKLSYKSDNKILLLSAHSDS